MALLFEPLALRSITLRNRIAVSPMCQYSAREGMASDWHLVHLGTRAVGGAGAVIVEATGVSPEGRISPGCLGIWNDEQAGMLQRIASFVQTQGSVPGIQLAHAGRKASHHRPWEGGKPLQPAEGAWTTLAPSALPFKEGDPIPKAVSLSEIDGIISRFREAARRALEAGFQIIEIHAAHGYLINEFLSPLSNQRGDEYGGSFDNRVRLLLQIVDAIRSVWPEQLPLFVRISATDWVVGGWSIEESVALARILKTKGVDLVDCSTGGLSPLQKIPAAPSYQVPFSSKIRREAGIATGAVGLITNAQQAEDILKYQQADLILLGRQMLRDPYFPLRAAEELGVEIPWPAQYLRARQ